MRSLLPRIGGEGAELGCVAVVTTAPEGSHTRIAAVAGQRAILEGGVGNRLTARCRKGGRILRHTVHQEFARIAAVGKEALVAVRLIDRMALGIGQRLPCCRGLRRVGVAVGLDRSGHGNPLRGANVLAHRS